VSTRSSNACVSCETPLPADAAFCHKCGTRTPQSIDKQTGEITGSTGGVDLQQRLRLQAALGETYEVRRLLGRGGFAEVFVAYDKRLKREIAVKTMRGDIVASANLLDRFQREAEAVAKLRHPNVVPIYSVGEGEGLAFYTMPIIEGESLASIVQRDGRLPVAEAVRILRDAAHALSAAHRADIIHRDIKPENIMLEGPERSVVVMDFGIAKTTSGAADEKGLTGTGMLVGTPQYMSPEQATGERTIDHRSDQYSLAMVGYRMLTGQLPFEHDSVQTILFKTVTEVPPTPTKLAADVPSELSDVIMRGLAKDPAHRFSTMADFAAALGGLAGGGDSRGPARRRRRDLPTRAREARARIAKPAIVWGAVGLLAVAAVAAMYLTLPSSVKRLARERDDAVFAATTFVNSRGQTQSRRAYAHQVSNDSAFRHLRRATSYAEADARASRDIAIWEWSMMLPNRDRSDVWQVWTAPGNRITGYRQRLSDTVPGARISSDSARVLAEAAIAERGWAPTKLTLKDDSTIQRKARTDHIVRWVSESLSVTPAGDTARMHVRATVAGDRVVAYREEFAPVHSKFSPTSAGLVAVVTLAVIAGIVILIVVAVRVSRNYDLEWLAMTRLVLGAGVLTIGTFGAALVRTSRGGNDGGSDTMTQMIVNAGVGGVIFGLFAIFAGALAEALAQRNRPTTAEGIDEISRGRVLVPELISGAPIGYLAAVTALLVDALINWAALKFNWAFGFSPDDPSTANPVFDALSAAGMSVMTTLALLAGLMLLAGWRWTSRFGWIVPGLVMAGFAMAADADPTTAARIVINVTVISAAMWYGGFVAGLIAMLVWELGDSAVPALIAGGPFLPAGLTGLAIILIPAALSFAARRRFERA
jgi:tRNA A-37 threonylcarbamoyl transferase component Bud32